MTSEVAFVSCRSSTDNSVVKGEKHLKAPQVYRGFKRKGFILKKAQRRKKKYTYVMQEKNNNFIHGDFLKK